MASTHLAYFIFLSKDSCRDTHNIYFGDAKGSAFRIQTAQPSYPEYSRWNLMGGIQLYANEIILDGRGFAALWRFGALKE